MFLESMKIRVFSFKFNDSGVQIIASKNENNFAVLHEACDFYELI